MPEGMRCSTVFLPAMTSVCPALCPPWKRTTPWARSVSQSTILPLPSSPHCVPITTTLRALIVAPTPRDCAGHAVAIRVQHHAGMVVIAAQLCQIETHRQLARSCEPAQRSERPGETCDAWQLLLCRGQNLGSAIQLRQQKNCG